MAHRSRPPSPRAVGPSLFGLPMAPLAPLSHAVRGSSEARSGLVMVVGKGADLTALRTGLEKTGAVGWQIDRALKVEREISQLAGTHGPVWVIKAKGGVSSETAHIGQGFDSIYSAMRDRIGGFYGMWEGFDLTSVTFDFWQMSEDERVGALVGLELAAYRYTNTKKPAPRTAAALFVKGATDPQLSKARAVATAMNIARHLVNTPPNELHPVSYAAGVAALFKGSATMKVEVWDRAKCKAEGLGLLSGTGQGAAHGPTLVRLRYRPKTAKKKQPIALVGKGVTFDSGGLDLKPSAAMRLMKKDMGGSAALVGLAWWLETTEHKAPIDLYLALAENAVSADAFRPGDVLTARNGMTVEINNTDAEGRLVMADAICVALEAKGADAPLYLIDVATLTGAVKVGLGSEIVGLLTNDDALAERFSESGTTWGDPVWRLPLYSGYDPHLKSPVADMMNCSNSPFGGAITAALFLQRFVGRKQMWAHLDIYAWNDGASGALRETGGSGQGVQLLIGLLRKLSS